MAIDLLKKPPGNRHKNDIGFLIHTFKDIAFFAKFYDENGIEPMKNLCRALQHQSGCNKSTVFQAGI